MNDVIESGADTAIRTPRSLDESRPRDRGGKTALSAVDAIESASAVTPLENARAASLASPKLRARDGPVTMLRLVLPAIALSLTLSACDESVPLTGSDDLVLRAGFGVRYDTNHLGDSHFEEISLNNASYDGVKAKTPYKFRLTGAKGHADVDLHDLLGAEIEAESKYKGEAGIARAEVIDLIETVPTALVLEIPNPGIELCDVVDGILILASTGECPE